jgi:hypothetical protein
MSSLTQRRRGGLVQFVEFIAPRVFRKPQPALIDGALETERTYQVLQLLTDLEHTSQARILWHVDQILVENANRIAAFDAGKTYVPKGNFSDRCRVRKAPAGRGRDLKASAS